MTYYRQNNEITYIYQNIIPLIDIAIKSMWLRLLPILKKELPKLLIFFPLVHNLDFLICFFVLLEQLHVLLGLVHVGCQVSLGDLGSLPNIHWVLTVPLNNKHGARIQHLVALLRVKLIDLQPARYFVGVFWLVRAHQEYARVNLYVVEIWREETFVEPD